MTDVTQPVINHVPRTRARRRYPRDASHPSYDTCPIGLGTCCTRNSPMRQNPALAEQVCKGIRQEALSGWWSPG
jgi:hypothetical protein